MKFGPKAKKRLCIALVLILIGSIFACLLQTNFFKVRIKDVSIMVDDQNYSHALMFVPKEASAENKVPVVITCHGWLNSGELQDAACIELSRRGIAVIAMDAVNHGMSSNDMALSDKGMHSWVEYAAGGALNFIDTTKIGVMGHSMGGFMSTFTLMGYAAAYDAAIAAAQEPDSDGGVEITEAEQAYAQAQYKISAALPTGNGPEATPDAYNYIHCNHGFLFGRYEEGGYSMSTGKANVLGATPEALNYIHSVDPSVTSVEDGKFYGNRDDGTLRVLYQPIITHPLIHFDPNSTARVIEFFTYCWNIDTPLSSHNQYFFIKECFNLLAMIGLFMMLVPMTELLLSVPCFEKLRGKEGPKVPVLTEAGKKKFWTGWVVGGVISFVTAIISVYLTYKIPWANDPFHASNLFPAPAMNDVWLWTLFNAIWGGFWFWHCFKQDKAAGVRTDEMIGWKISSKEFWNTLGLTVTILGFMYAVVWFCKWLFNTDFRFWTPAIRVFTPEKLLTYIQYWPVFFFFYLFNSLMVNGACRVEGSNEKKELLICAIGNILGCFTLWLIQYGKLVITGSVLFKMPWCDVLVICFCIWQLFLAPFMLRSFYKLTGKNWLGPLVVSSVYVLAGVMNTAIHTNLF